MEVELNYEHGNGCPCGACNLPMEDVGGIGVAGGGAEGSVDGQGGTINNKPVFDLDQVIAQINRTSQNPANFPADLDIRPGWHDGSEYTIKAVLKSGDAMEFRYGFYDAQTIFSHPYVYTGADGKTYGRSEYFGFAEFTDAQKAAAKEAIQYWDDIIAPSFVQVEDARDADITFGNLMNRPGTQAYAYLPYNYGGNSRNLQGDVWVTGTTNSNFQLDVGLYGLNTLTHELGHSLGLQHPGRYNFAPGFQVNYANGAEYFQDARNYSIMSYWNPRDVGARDYNWNLHAVAYGATPMVHDIATAQHLYGADMTTRAGDNTYGFNASGEGMRAAFDFTQNEWPTMAIWDAGGIDTLDASGYKVEQVIDLTPGSLSSIGGLLYEDAPTYEEVNAARKAAGFLEVDPATGAAKAGTGVYVTQAFYDGNMAAWAAQPEFRGRLTDNVGIAYGAIIENAEGGSGKDTIIGNDVANRLNGNAGNDRIEGRNGNDILLGGEGDDILIGGDGIDVMSGGAGNNVFIAQINAAKAASKTGPISIDIFTDFNKGGDDVIDLSGIDANLGAEGIQAFTFVGHSNPGRAGEMSIRTFGNVNAAEKALGIEIDGIEGVGTSTGPVTVALGNVDGGAPDLALVFMDTASVTAADLMLASAARAGDAAMPTEYMIAA